MENCRTNEVLAEQIGVLQEFAAKLDPADLKQLKMNLDEIENVTNALKDLMKYLPE